MSSHNLKDEVCMLCCSGVNDEFKYGKKCKKENIVAHYYCLLFACGLEQNGSDNEGIFGFLEKDIVKEIKRGKRLKCRYCKKLGATTACCLKKCRNIFHLRCGLANGSLHQYFGNFASYCDFHRPFQKIPSKTIKAIVDTDCPICYRKFNRKKERIAFDFLVTPCCTKLIHRDCIQRHSLNAGYFFKCPICNNDKEFIKEMQIFGIYIPEQDASWELEENAFNDLLFRYNKCDAKTCFCPKGREFDEKYSCWDIAICKICASSGVHVKCGNIYEYELRTWVCPVCSAVEKKHIKSKKRKLSISNKSLNEIASTSHCSNGSKRKIK